jgi:hypothetical protein
MLQAKWAKIRLQLLKRVGDKGYGREFMIRVVRFKR